METLHLSDEGVRWLVLQGRLRYHRTRSGQYLFEAYDVEQLGRQRLTAALAPVKPRMVKAALRPAKALGDRQAKADGIVREVAISVRR